MSTKSNNVMFYTYAPQIGYPWIMRNIKQKSKRWHHHEIVDIGVYELLKDPYTYSDKTLDKWRELNKRIPYDSILVVPDYPDIHKEHGTDLGIDNIFRSKELMLEFYDPDNTQHLPVIQGEFNDPQTFLWYSRWFKKEFGVPGRIGVGTICKSSTKATQKEVLEIIKKEFPKTMIHAFGLSIRWLQELKHLISSFDTMAWTFPREHGGHSAKNKKERLEYFIKYRELVHQKINGGVVA